LRGHEEYARPGEIQSDMTASLAQVHSSLFAVPRQLFYLKLRGALSHLDSEWRVAFSMVSSLFAANYRR
jgi:hypothetical protein